MFRFRKILNIFRGLLWAGLPFMLPAQTTNTTTDLQALIDQGIANRSTQISIAPGIYTVTPQTTYPRSARHLTVENATNLSIIMDGVRIVCQENKTALSISQCSNVKVQGLTVDYDPLPFTQGTVTLNGPGDLWFEVDLHTGYPNLDVTSGNVFVYEAATSLWKRGLWTSIFCPQISTNLGTTGRKLRVTLTNALQGYGIQEGDLVSFNRKPLSPHVMQVLSSERCTLENITLFTGPGFAVLEKNGAGNAYLRCQIKPGPAPVGASVQRLRANMADGIHSIASRVGPKIDGCLITAQGDDGVAIHGQYAVVIDVTNGRAVVAPCWDDLPFGVADKVRLTRALDGALVTNAIVLSFQKITDGAPVARYHQMKSNLDRGDPARWAMLTSFYEVALSVPYVFRPGDLIDNPKRSGSGFTVANNTIRNHRARGILIKASDGLITNNHIDGSGVAGIVLSPEPWPWMESGAASNVLIRGNWLKNCGWEHDNPYASQAGTITVACRGSVSNEVYAASGVQQDIAIVGNCIEDCAGVNLLVASTRGLLIASNRFTRPGLSPRATGTRFGVDTNAVIWIHKSTLVRVADNRISNAGPHASAFLSLATDMTAASVSNLDGALRYQSASDFGPTQGLRGWHYLDKTGPGLYTEMMYIASSNKWVGSTPWCTLTSAAAHPGTGSGAVRKWVAPFEGTVMMTGTLLRPGTTGDGTYNAIRKGLGTLWGPIYLSPFGTNGASYFILRQVRSGDIFYLETERGSSTDSDYTAWSATFDYLARSY